MLSRFYNCSKIWLKALFGVFFIASFFNLIPVQAQNANLSLAPGETGLFKIKYTNGGDTPLMENASLIIRVGDQLQVDPNSFLDQLDDGTQYPVVSSVMTNVGSWGATINYRPFSAQDENSPSGTSQPEDIELPLNSEGFFYLRATLNPNILNETNSATGQPYQVGEILDTVDLQGINSVIDFDGDSVNSSLRVEIEEPTNPEPEPEPEPQPEPLIPTISFNPNPGVIGEQLTVTTRNLGDANAVLYDGIECTTTLTGSSYQETATGTVQNGVCTVIFASSQTPLTIGTYEATTTAGQTTAGPGSVDFTVVATDTPRSGGTVNLVIGSISVGFLVLFMFYLLKRTRLKTKQKL